MESTVTIKAITVRGIMNKYFRICSLCMVCVLVLGILSGCGSSTVQKQETNQANNDKQTEADSLTEADKTGEGNQHTTEATQKEQTKPINRIKVELNGKKYEYNDHLSNFLFLGIDKEDVVSTKVGAGDAGQTDALFLMSWDRVTGDVKIFSIPRDTMTMINVYGRDGTDLGPVEQHISLAYGYGDGRHKSCELAEEAVSKLFYRIPIQGYCAVTMKALEEMSSILGGVTVTIPNDSLEQKSKDMAKGATITVNEENVEIFIRYRDTKITNSAIHRLERQNAFMTACYQKLIQEFPGNPGIITDIYMGIEPYRVTNIGNDQFVKIMEGVTKGGSVERFTIPGEGVATDTFDEFHVDEDALYEQIVLNFFNEVTD